MNKLKTYRIIRNEGLYNLLRWSIDVYPHGYNLEGEKPVVNVHEKWTESTGPGDARTNVHTYKTFDTIEDALTYVKYGGWVKNEEWQDLTEKVFKWFDEKGLDDPVMQTVKIMEETGELASEVARNRYDSNEIKDAVGDSLVTILGLCHHLNLDPYECLDMAYKEISGRKGKVVNGSFVKEEAE